MRAQASPARTPRTPAGCAGLNPGADQHRADRARRVAGADPLREPAPSRRLDVPAAEALVAQARASIVRAASTALDEIAARQELAELAHARGWDVHLYDAKAVVDQATRVLAGRADQVLHEPRQRLGPPWTKDHRVALAAAIVAGRADPPRRGTA